MLIITYNSQNQSAKYPWVAYILHEGDYLPVRFHGETEEEAFFSAQAEWDKHEKERKANIKRLEEGRAKKAATLVRKKVLKNGQAG